MRTRFEEFLKEDFPNVLSTVGMTGKGESISGYPVSNFATATGYSVGGRDTIDGAEISASTPGDSTSPGFSLYKNKKRKLNKRDKQERLKNQIGATVDTLYKPIKRATNEGSETTPYPGSGTNVGFGEQPLSFVKSAGQAIYGGDSESAMAGNSNSAIGNVNKEELTSTPRSRPNFKDIKKRKHRINKNSKPYNQIGKTIDGLYKGQKKVTNEAMKTFEEFTKLYEDGEGAGSAGGGGSATATLGNTGGMGAIVSAQPSSTPGDVAGSTKGSGDIGQPLGVYSKNPAGQTQRKKLKKNKNKKDKPYHKIGAGIDNFYRTKYVQSGSNKNVIQSWKAFTDVKI